jgi:hypothetical protein
LSAVAVVVAVQTRTVPLMVAAVPVVIEQTPVVTLVAVYRVNQFLFYLPVRIPLRLGRVELVALKLITDWELLVLHLHLGQYFPMAVVAVALKVLDSQVHPVVVVDIPVPLGLN